MFAKNTRFGSAQKLAGREASKLSPKSRICCDKMSLPRRHHTYNFPREYSNSLTAIFSCLLVVHDKTLILSFFLSEVDFCHAGFVSNVTFDMAQTFISSCVIWLYAHNNNLYQATSIYTIKIYTFL